MTDMMRLLLAREGKKCVALSLDDFYLTGADQDALAASHALARAAQVCLSS